MPPALLTLLNLPNAVFENCLDVSSKFSLGEIIYSSKKSPDFYPLPYKVNNIKCINADSFWSSFCKSHRQNAEYALNILNKMSSTYGIEDALNEFKSTVADFQQQLINSGVKYSGTYEDAIADFGLASNTTQDQLHFLLSNRLIQKQLTRQNNFNLQKAKENISDFLKKVRNIDCQLVDEIVKLENFEFIVCFEELDWSSFDLPKNCVIADFCCRNDAQLGQQIPHAWNIQFVTKNPQIPENGNLPLTTVQGRIYLLIDGAENTAENSRENLQRKAEEKSIKLGNVMQITDISAIFKFAEDKASCYIHEPPMEWIDLITTAILTDIKECSAITVSSKNANKQARFKETLANGITAQWGKQAEEAATPLKPRASRKRGLTSTSVPPSPQTSRRSNGSQNS
uniref:Uncharacterized protein n=1 Tax=Panagrolaimus superbus TaxID=310955 RepID=A0A914ZC74_9BILA